MSAGFASPPRFDPRAPFPPPRADSWGTPKKPVVIRGIEYCSIHQAADILGVSRKTIRDAIRRGALNRVGTGRRRGR